ncbi:MAG: MMPL family transporter [Bacteroidales bacterium]|nr:MMPL family transporter [Bacteroidales bacterium]
MWVKLARIILKNRTAILIVLSVLTLFMGYEATKVKLSYEYVSMLPQTDSSYKQFVQFKKDFGSDANGMIIGMKTKHLFELNTFNKFMDMCDTIHSFDGVDNVMSVGHAMQIEGSSVTKYFKERPQTQEELDSISALILNQPLYRGMLFSDDTSTYVLLLTMRQSILDSPAREQLIGTIQDIVEKFSAETSVEVFFTGMPFIRTQTSLKLQNELIMFIVLAVLVCAIILLFIFKSFKNMMFSMLVVAVSVIWVLGWMGLFHYEISAMSSMLPPLIIVISVPNCVFFLNKYHQEFAVHGNKIKALQRTIYKVGNAVFLSNLTTSIGFFTFIFTSSPMLKEFGIIASLGIMGVFVFSMLILSTVFSFLAAPSAQMLKHLDSKMFTKVVDFILLVTSKYRHIVYAVTGVLLVVALVGASKIQSTGYVVDDLPQDDAIMRDLKYAEEKFKGVLPLEIQIEDTAKINLMSDRAFMKKVQQLTDSLGKYPEVAKPLSIIDFVKFAWQAHNGGDSKYYTLPNSSDIFFKNKMKKIVKGTSEGLGSLQYSLVDSTGRKIRVRCSAQDIGTNNMANLERSLRKDLDAIFPPDRYKTLITGTSAIYFKGTQYLLKNLYVSLMLAIVIIAFFMALLFRSKRMVLVSLIPNILPLFFTAALMGFIGIPIKMTTIFVFSVAFGISVDDTIHLLSRYRQQLKATNGEIRNSVLSAVQETSPSLISTSIILFFGFMVFSFSEFGGTQAMGILVSLTLLFAMLFNNLLLPSMLLTLDKRITTKHFQEPLLDIYNEEEDIELENLQIED